MSFCIFKLHLIRYIFVIFNYMYFEAKRLVEWIHVCSLTCQSVKQSVPLPNIAIHFRMLFCCCSKIQKACPPRCSRLV